MFDRTLNLLTSSQLIMGSKETSTPMFLNTPSLLESSLKELNTVKFAALLGGVTPSSSDAVSDSSSVESSKRHREEATVKEVESSPKRLKTLSHPPVSRSALHKACRRGPDLTVDELEDILSADPTAAYRPVRLTTTKSIYNPTTYKMEPKVVREPYKYALNLAISYKASAAVLERLVAAAPPVLSLRDNNSCPLHILLKHMPDDATSIDVMLLTRPEATSWQDLQRNTALHVAVRNGAHLNTIRHLVTVNPEALQVYNRHGYTPLKLAQRHTVTCSNEVSEYLIQESSLLWEQQNRREYDGDCV